MVDIICLFPLWMSRVSDNVKWGAIDQSGVAQEEQESALCSCHANPPFMADFYANRVLKGSSSCLPRESLLPPKIVIHEGCVFTLYN